jgi:hypothetical protein
MLYHDVCFVRCIIITDFGRAMMFRVESSCDQCPVGVDNVSKKREIGNFENPQTESGRSIQVLKHVTDLIKSDLYPQVFFLMLKDGLHVLLVVIALTC